jgi:hypoxanthine phosphoribosyltransferase
MTEKKWEKVFITPQKFHDDILKLTQLIPKDKYKLMIGIPRGGYIIAVYLSHYFDLAWMDFEKFNQFKRYSNKTEVLIVDDIADTGDTLKDFKDFDCATLYYKPRSIIKPTYYIEQFKNSNWIVYPFERIEEVPNREV